jgi:hypothetical protein
MDSNRPVMGERVWDQGRQSAVALNRWGEFPRLKFPGPFLATLIAVVWGKVLGSAGSRSSAPVSEERVDRGANAFSNAAVPEGDASRVGLNIRCSRGAWEAGGRGGGL